MSTSQVKNSTKTTTYTLDEIKNIESVIATDKTTSEIDIQSKSWLNAFDTHPLHTLVPDEPINVRILINSMHSGPDFFHHHESNEEFLRISHILVTCAKKELNRPEDDLPSEAVLDAIQFNTTKLQRCASYASVEQPEHLDHFEATVADINQRIEKIRATKRQAPIVEVLPDPSVAADHKFEEAQDIWPCKEPIGSTIAANTYEIQAPHLHILEQLDLPDFNNLEAALRDISHRLDEAVEVLSPRLENGEVIRATEEQKLKLKEIVNPYLRKIMRLFPPVVNSPENYWNQIPEDRIPFVLSELDKLGNTLMKTFGYMPWRAEPVSLCLQYSILAASDLLARRLAPEKLQGYHVECEGFFESLKDKYFIVHDGVICNKLNQLSAYFSELKDNHPKPIFQKLSFLTDTGHAKIKVAHEEYECDSTKPPLNENLSPKAFVERCALRNIFFTDFKFKGCITQPKVIDDQLNVSFGNPVKPTDKLKKEHQLFYTINGWSLAYFDAFRGQLDYANLDQLKNVHANPYDRINQAIAYFRTHLTHLDLYSNLESIPFLQDTIFQFGSLRSQLDDQPDFIHVLNNFFAESIKHFRDKSEFSTAGKLLVLFEAVGNFLMETEHPSGEQLLDTVSQVEAQLLQAATLSHDRQDIMCLLILSALIPQLNSADQNRRMSILKKAAPYFALMQLKDSFSFDFIRHFFVSTPFQILHSQLKQGFENDAELRAITMGMIRYTLEGGENTPTDARFENGILKCDRYSYNITNGKISRNDDSVYSAAPKFEAHTRADGWYKRLPELCPGKLSYFRRPQDDFWTVISSDVACPPTKIMQNGELIQTFNGIEYKLLQNTGIRDFLPHHKDKKYYISCEPSNIHIIVLDVNNEKLLTINTSEVCLDEGVGAITPSSILRSDGLNFTNDLNITHTLAGLYSNCWYSNAENLVKEFNLYNFKSLDFVVKTNSDSIHKSFCTQHPGFHLIKSPTIEALLPGISHNVILKNDETGVIKVLLKSSYLHRNTEFDDNGRPQIEAMINEELSSIYEYEFKDGKLKAVETFGQRFLAYLLTVQGRYKEASQCLQEIYANHPLGWPVFMNKFNTFLTELDDPRAIGLRLQLTLIKHELRHWNGLFDHENLVGVMDRLYVEYLEKKDICAETALSEKQERHLLQFLMEYETSNRTKYRERVRTLRNKKITVKLSQSNVTIPDHKNQPPQNGKKPTVHNLRSRDQDLDKEFAQLLKKHFVSEKKTISATKVEVKTEGADENIHPRIREENIALDEYYQSDLNIKKKVEWSLRKGTTLQKLTKELNDKRARWNTDLKTFKQLIVWQANQMLPDSSVPLTWKDVATLVVSSVKASSLVKPTKLLKLAVGDYYIRKTRLQQIEGAIEALNSHHTHEAIEKAAQRLSQKRAYTADSAHFGLLAMEAAVGHLYRKDQLDKIQELNRAGKTYKEILAEMPTGWGKTKALAPELLSEHGDQETLIVGAWPASAEVINTEGLKKTLKKASNKYVDTFSFHRNVYFSAERLKILYQELKNDIGHGYPLSTRIDSLRALELHFILKLYENKDSTPEIDNQIKYYAKILRLLRVNGWSLIDEAHINLSPKDKLVYSIGKPTTIPDDHVELILFMFKQLLNGELKSIMDITGNNQASVTEQQFKDIVIPKLAEAFVKKLSIPKSKREDFKKFLQCQTDEIPGWIVNDPNRSNIALAKGLVSFLLKTSCQGYVDVHYGFSKLNYEKIKFAISYAGNNKPKETDKGPSQFKNCHETVIKTLFTYLAKGLQNENVSELIKHLQQMANDEISEGSAFENTEAAKIFSEILPETERNNQRWNLLQMKEADSKDLLPLIAHKQEAIFNYVSCVVVPQINIYEKTIVNTAQNFRAMVNSSLSMSATPQEVSSHGPTSHFIGMKGASGQITHLLLTKSQNVDVTKELEAVSLVDEAGSNAKKNPQATATVDVGALFKGVSNIEAARRLKEKLRDKPDVSGVVFFDESDEKFKIYHFDSDTVQPLDDANYNPDKHHSYFDEQRSYASDVTNALKAHFTLTLGKFTDKNAAGQAAGRARKLHEEQTLGWLLQEELSKQAFKGEQPTPMQILHFLLSNQLNSDAESNFRSQKQQMDNEVRRTMLDELLGLGSDRTKWKANAKQYLDVNRIKSSFKQFKEVLVENESLDPWDMYAGITTNSDAITELKLHQSLALNKVEETSGLSRTDKTRLRKTLTNYADKWATEDGKHKMLLPKSVFGNATEIDEEIEVLEEQEVENQDHNPLAKTPKEHPIVGSHIKRTPTKWDENIDLFTEGWEKPTDVGIVHRVCQFVNRMVLDAFRDDLEGYIIKSSTITAVTGVLGLGLWVGGLTTTAIVVSAIGLGILVTYIGAAVIIGRDYFILSTKIKYHYANKKCSIHTFNKELAWDLPQKSQKAAKMFTDDFLFTDNFWQLEATLNPKNAFRVDQKEIYQLLVIEDTVEGEKQYKAIAIDIHDAIFLREKFKQDLKVSEQIANARTRKVGLYDLTNNFFAAEGKNRFNLEEVQKEEEFIKLVAQAKFFNGELSYTKEEREQLSLCVKKVGGPAARRLYSKHILARFREKQTRWQKRPIARVLA